MAKATPARAEIARLRAQAADEHWTVDALAEAIQKSCGVSPLAAHRHARGWTLAEAAQRLDQLRDSVDQGRTTAQQVSKWENGVYVPKTPVIHRLSQLYRTDADQLGLGAGEQRNIQTKQNVARAVSARTRAGARIATPASLSQGGTGDVMDELEDVRRSLGITLNSELSDTAISFLERRVANYDSLFRVGTSARAVIDVSRDLNAAHELLHGAHSPDSTRRLLTVIAQLSVILGIQLLCRGDIREADQWMLTGELAAERTEDRQLRAWVTARQALIPIHYGNPDDALGLADRALALAGTREATVAGTRALIIKARVLAGTDQKATTLAVADKVRQWYTQLSGTDVTDSLLGLRPAQLAGHLGEIYTNIGESQKAIEQHNLVLNLFDQHDPTPEGCLMPEGCLDYGFTQLSVATNLITDREFDHACVVASRALLRIPAACCETILLQEARKVAMAIPERSRTAAWNELRDVLAFRKQ